MTEDRVSYFSHSLTYITTTATAITSTPAVISAITAAAAAAITTTSFCLKRYHNQTLNLQFFYICLFPCLFFLISFHNFNLLRSAHAAW